MDNYLDIFTEPKKIFQNDFKSIDELKHDCIYILDTNVLLLPYTVGNKELKEIEKIYTTLIDQKRLHVPAQVAKEFAKNRPKKIEEMYKHLSDHLSKILKHKVPQYPLLSDVDEYKELLASESKLDKEVSEYKSKVKSLLKYIQDLNWNEPVSNLYSKLFTEDVVVDYGWIYDEVQKELSDRHKFNIPPAYKDKGKNDKGIGDYIIWKDIIETSNTLKKNIIFVTGDEKADWFHQSMKSKLYPRFELLHEFKTKSGGFDVSFISLSELISIFSDDSIVIENLKSAETYIKRRFISKRFRHIALKNNNYKCELCNSDFKDIELEGTRILELHIIDRNKDNNDLSNIAVLCPNCHRTIDNNKKDYSFKSGSPCEMSGQRCPSCQIGIMEVVDARMDDGVECSKCGLFIPA